MRNLIAVAVITAVWGVGIEDAAARSIRGTVWCAQADPDCGADAAAGPERIEGAEITLCSVDGTALESTLTDAEGNYAFVNLQPKYPDQVVFSVKVTGGVPDGKELGNINCLNTAKTESTPCTETDTPQPEVCTREDLATATSEVDTDAGFQATDNFCDTRVTGIDFVYCTPPPPPPPPPPPSLCWMTGGGVKFERHGDIWSAEMGRGGPKDSVGGVVAPSCSPFPSNGGQWNHVAHSLKTHVQGFDIEVIRCGNVEGIEPGTESPVCEVNFIEFQGTGRASGIGGNKMETIDISFFGRVEDRNEPGNEQSATSGDDIDRYFLRVVDSEGGLVLLVDEDGVDDGSVDPLTITGGNFQIHCTSCDDAGEGGGGSVSPYVRDGFSFLRGDANHDGEVDISDPLTTLGYLFGTGEMPACPDAADANDDGELNIADAITSFGVMFVGGTTFAAPYPVAWLDPTDDDNLGCGHVE